MCDFLDDFDGEFINDDFIDENSDGYEYEELSHDYTFSEREQYNNDSIIDDVSIADSFLIGGIGGLIYEDISKNRERRKRLKKNESGDS